MIQRRRYSQCPDVVSIRKVHRFIL
ncbi:hypothetical protein CGRA01v4_04500 [Colletotrichum graminicola]|nr:hypothetical protein CGRA01v4_04500 [Colletotrichum graminicola]